MNQYILERVLELNDTLVEIKDRIAALRDKMVEDLDAMIEDDAAYERQTYNIEKMEETLQMIGNLQPIPDERIIARERITQIKDLLEYCNLVLNNSFYTYTDKKEIIIALFRDTIKS